MMRKLYVAFALSGIIIFQFCTSTRKTSTTQLPARATYTAQVQPLIVGNCSPCHMPPQGNKKPYDTYASVKGDIDEIISRVQKNPGDKGFMPFRHPKLSDSAINVLVQWKKDGFPEN